MILRAPTCYSRDIQRPAQMRPAKIIDGPLPQSALLRIHFLPLCLQRTVSGFDSHQSYGGCPFFQGVGRHGPTTHLIINYQIKANDPLNICMYVNV